MSEIARYYPTENAHINGLPVPKGTYLVKGSDYEVLEERIKQLEAQLKEANAVAEFYGGTDCYAVVLADGQVDGFSEEEPGKRARAYLKKWEGK